MIIAGLGFLAQPASAEPVTEGHRQTLHFTVNFNSSEEVDKAVSLGYNLIDTGPSEEAVNELPAGAKAMIWAGNTQCGDWDFPFEEFQALVDELADNPRVYGYYLSDEPIVTECPHIVGEIKRRADHIRSAAPHQKSFIVADDHYQALRPANSHVDFIGLDPHPCHTGRPCDFGEIETMVQKALNGGVPRSAIIPDFQTFGQECSNGEEHEWRLPTERELITSLLIWHRLVPNPAFEYSYSFGNQEGISCPTLVDADGTNGLPNLQRIMKLHNAWHGGGRSLDDALNG